MVDHPLQTKKQELLDAYDQFFGGAANIREWECPVEDDPESPCIVSDGDTKCQWCRMAAGHAFMEHERRVTGAVICIALFGQPTPRDGADCDALRDIREQVERRLR